MTLIKFFIPFVFISVLWSNNIRAQSLSVYDIKSLDKYLQSLTSSETIPGMVTIVANKKKVIYKSVSGFNSISNNDTLLIDDIFDIASMTKAITCVVIMQLYEQGRLSLDDPAQKYLPAIANLQVIDKFNRADTTYTTRPVVKPITIKQLLTHTSGIGYAFCNDTLAMISQKKTNNQGASYLSFPLLHEPGTAWTYGMSMDVLGDIIESITDTALDVYYNEKIFKPLGMLNTFYTVPTEKYSRLTNLYQHTNGQFIEQSSGGIGKPTIKGGNGLYSTAGDYTRFLQMLLNKGTFNGAKILGKKSVNAMTKNQIGNLFVTTQPGALPKLADSFPSRGGKDKFGYGFVIRTSINHEPGTRNPGSYDWGGLFNTYYWVDTLQGITAVVMMQVKPFYDPLCIDALNNFEKMIYQLLNKTPSLLVNSDKQANKYSFAGQN
jgi:methyl acetate hydrolase